MGWIVGHIKINEVTHVIRYRVNYWKMDDNFVYICRIK